MCAILNVKNGYQESFNRSFNVRKDNGYFSNVQGV